MINKVGYVMLTDVKIQCDLVVMKKMMSAHLQNIFYTKNSWVLPNY